LASRSDGNTYQACADVSYDLAAGATKRVEPFVRFAWVALDTAAFTETGGVAALTSHRGAYTTDVTTADLRGALALTGFTLKASAGAQHTVRDRSPAALLALAGTNSPASISAVLVDRWALAADVSGEFRLAPTATFTAAYSGVNGSRTRDNGVRGTLTFGFKGYCCPGLGVAAPLPPSQEGPGWHFLSAVLVPRKHPPRLSPKQGGEQRIRRLGPNSTRYRGRLAGNIPRR